MNQCNILNIIICQRGRELATTQHPINEKKKLRLENKLEKLQATLHSKSQSVDRRVVGKNLYHPGLYETLKAVRIFLSDY